MVMIPFIPALLTCLFASTTFAHDGGHGPQVSDTGKYGGIVSAVVKKSDANKGDKAPLVHKAELSKSADGTVRIYLYDTEMKPLDLKTFDAQASAVVATKVKGKWKDTPFTLERKDNAFIGKMPKPEAKPYNLDITLKASGGELLSAFDNLD